DQVMCQKGCHANKDDWTTTLGLTITPGVFIEENDGADDLTGIILKSSFVF
ncbi:hypothetical protein HA148_05940, partial [Prochlorococcus marinus XMU1405]|nr:hypothetical protein [Prochlorococcus marinus XMU1405]